MKSSSGLLAAALLIVAVPALAQSTTQPTTPSTPTLSDLAKRAQEKKGTPAPAKTFTNDDLKNVNVPPDDASGSGDAKSGDAKDGKDGKDAKGAKSGDAAKPGDAAKAGDAKKDDQPKADPTKSEQYWRDRMNAAREDVRRNQAFATALQSRINALTADFTSRDDPAQRAQIADERQKALAELDRVNKAVDDGNKAIAAVEEDARKAMVPAGWIR